MGKAHSIEVRKRVLADIRAGMSLGQVARREGVSKSTVYEFRELWRKTGLVKPLPRGGGRKRLLDADDLTELRRLRAEAPKATLRELAERLEERCGVRAGIATVRRALTSMGITYHRREHKPLAASPGESPARPFAFAPVSVAPRTTSGRRTYPSDLTDAEWEFIEPMIPKCKAGGRPEAWSRRELVDAMLYVLRNGNTWRALPHDFPPWSTVYSYFRKWRMSGLWQQVNDALRSEVRRRAGRGSAPTAAIMDSQSAHTTEKGGLAAGTATNA